MSDIEQKHTTTTANKSFLSALSDELIAAQKAAKKHHNALEHQLLKPLPRTTREAKVADNTTGHNYAVKNSYQPRDMMPAHPQKTVLPVLKTTAKPSAVARSIVESAAQKITKRLVRSNNDNSSRDSTAQRNDTTFGDTLRSDNSARPTFHAAPAQAAAVSYDKALRRSEPDTINAKFYRTESSTVTEENSRRSSLQDSGAKDAVVNYARGSLPPVSLPATLLSLRPLPPLQLEPSLSVSPAQSAPTQTTVDSARYLPNSTLGIPGTCTEVLRVSEMPTQTLQIPQATRMSQTQLLQQLPPAAPTFRPQDTAVPARNETGTFFAPDPDHDHINVRINVRSFTAATAQQVKSVAPNLAPQLNTTSLRTDSLYRMPEPGEPLNDDGDDNGTTPPNPNIRRFRTGGDTAGGKRYTLGAEIALAALTAAAGSSRRRIGNEPAYEESPTTNSPYLESTVSLLKGAPIKMQVIPARRRPTMLIGKQDNLIAIAEKNFDDANLGWLIADLNRAVSNQVELNGKYLVEFESRQEIVLPVWDDIVEFYEANKGRFDNTMLITIVRQDAVDQEFLETTLGPLLSQS